MSTWNFSDQKNCKNSVQKCSKGKFHEGGEKIVDLVAKYLHEKFTTIMYLFAFSVNQLAEIVCLFSVTSFLLFWLIPKTYKIILFSAVLKNYAKDISYL